MTRTDIILPTTTPARDNAGGRDAKNMANLDESRLDADPVLAGAWRAAEGIALLCEHRYEEASAAFREAQRMLTNARPAAEAP